jgi:2-polyprenyl-3-methyl-5-hydroxy-6-metoxy-1,4-benzoquinol methylase
VNRFDHCERPADENMYGNTARPVANVRCMAIPFMVSTVGNVPIAPVTTPGQAFPLQTYTTGCRVPLADSYALVQFNLDNNKAVMKAVEMSVALSRLSFSTSQMCTLNFKLLGLNIKLTFYRDENLMASSILITQDILNCELCGHNGTPYQNEIRDPDHQIAGDWNFKICSNNDCLAVWLSPRPLDSELVKAYENYHSHSKQKTPYLQKFLLSITKRILTLISQPHEIILGIKSEARRLKYMGLVHEKPASLLELGVGGGRFLYRMKKRGWDVTGVDIDPSVTARLLKKYQINIYTGDVTDISFDKKFDVIAMNQTIEHLLDPVAVLNKCYESLKPGGRIVITTPNIESVGASLFKQYWRGWEPPRHLHLYSRISLEKLARHAKFEINRIDTYTCEAQIGYYASYLNKAFQTSNSLSTFKLIGVMIWSYWMELNESILNRKSKLSGQGLYLEAIKIV